tara:strand:- start:840 stop:1580 length:741 start_codon:yes stop_codon:yes gene_type:complete
MQDVTFLIKTFERPQCLQALLASIATYHPTVAVLVCDDSSLEGSHRTLNEQMMMGRAHWRYCPTDYDVGLSAGRNILIEQCRTPYFVLFDDDFILFGESHVEYMVDYVRHDLFDICGGALRHERRNPVHFEGFFKINGQTLHCWHERRSLSPMRCDIVFNFLAGKTEVAQRVQWDDDLKMGEHYEFFIRCKEHGVRVGYCPATSAIHKPYRGHAYADARQRKSHKYRDLFYQKRGFTQVAGRLNEA